MNRAQPPRPITFRLSALLIILTLGSIALLIRAYSVYQIQHDFDQQRTQYLEKKVRRNEQLVTELAKAQNELQALLKFQWLNESELQPSSTDVQIPQLPAIVRNLYETPQDMRDQKWRQLLYGFIEQIDFNWMATLPAMGKLETEYTIAEITEEACPHLAIAETLEQQKSEENALHWAWLRWQKALIDRKPHATISDNRRLAVLLLVSSSTPAAKSASKILALENSFLKLPWVPMIFSSKQPLDTHQLTQLIKFLPLLLNPETPIALRESWTVHRSPLWCAEFLRASEKQLLARLAKFEQGDLGDLKASAEWFQQAILKNEFCHFNKLKALWKEEGRDTVCAKKLINAKQQDNLSVKQYKKLQIKVLKILNSFDLHWPKI